VQGNNLIVSSRGQSYRSLPLFLKAQQLRFMATCLVSANLETLFLPLVAPRAPRCLSPGVINSP